MPLTTIRLHGTLADQYTPELRADIDCVADAVSALQANYPSFKRSLIELHEAGMVFRVVVRHQEGDEWELDETQLFVPIGRGEIIITDVPAGSSATARIIAGIALVAITVATGGLGLPATTAAGLALAGGSMALGGFVELLGTPKTPDAGKEKENERSLILNGTSNTAQRGSVTPVIYGKGVFAGSVFISGAIRAQTIIFDDEDDSVADD